MVPTVVMTASVKTRLHATLRMGRASAQRVGQGHIATSRVRRGHLASTAPITVHVNPEMLRDHAMSKMGHVFAGLVTEEIGMSGRHLTLHNMRDVMSNFLP